MYFEQLRPRQWTKNILVFAALIFSIKKSNVDMLFHSIIGFFLFCFVSSSVYVLNDFVDREADRQHPEKCKRPMASGAINPYGALFMGTVLLVFSLAAAFTFSPLFAVLLLVYFALNVAYSFKLKHVVILDILIIASGFVFRAIGGGLVINVQLTPWFLICTLLLSLFLAISKRRHELYLLQSNKGSHRKVLDSYSLDLLNQFNSIVTTATIMSYALFTFTSGHTIQLMWTLVFVLYGVFRYLYLIHMEGKGGKPEKVLFQDRHILVTVLLYGFSVVLILFYFE
ncbi:decaprenyl-phosphate phosphoribosyltransferase [Aneurinibacillus sp. Ricciae_BoGa-3]|uniref:decaprenyl-phosphate phosphoribosyltransferase n=1 Tax=Aneurinibacillus sp. Ricciae_BoGa-3 TaxID=3022697 RepID=UPI002341D684|nr:decaprenyl-phosphate phosphoribosyltransferase [Aneurinibacillus sp. Ricciae_BoGa-3]WCK56855.1 decaprenyl-phosphate phosphoribosyltransferase [Aneurinibacillus sp. Ricciae_BoGa-3]